MKYCKRRVKSIPEGGRKVQSLFNESQQAGYHQATWNAMDVSSGIYFYKIRAGDYARTKKMVLSK